MRLGTVVAAIVGGLAGAALVMVGQGIELRLSPVGMDYKDFAGILLGASALVVTAVGVVIAVAAIWGFSGIKSGAEVAAVKHVADLLSNGPLGPRLDAAFQRYVERRWREGYFRNLLEEKLDEALYGQGFDRSTDVDEEFEDEETAPEAPPSGPASDSDASRQ